MAGPSQPIQDKSNLEPSRQETIDSLEKVGKRGGIAGKPIDEPVPTLELAESEKLVGTSPNNSFIIVGRDRPQHKRTGFGGKGATQAGRIDLIAGLGSSFKRQDGSYGPPNADTLMSPNFALDGARVYISQKTELDKYMGLAPTPGQLEIGSGIGLKADSIRIHARHDVKIVTGRSRFEGLGDQGERLSDGTPNQRVGNISLVAGNYNSESSMPQINMFKFSDGSSIAERVLQPIPKGDRLVACLGEIIDKMSEILTQVQGNTQMINVINTSLIAHIHPFPTGPSPTYAAPGGVCATQLGLATAAQSPLIKAIPNIKINYLQDGSGGAEGGGYINSKHVFTT